MPFKTSCCDCVFEIRKLLICKEPMWREIRAKCELENHMYDYFKVIFNGWYIIKMTDKIQDRQRLANVITQWNQDHYDLFELSQPNEVKQEVFVIIRTFFYHKLLYISLVDIWFSNSVVYLLCYTGKLRCQQIFQDGRLVDCQSAQSI